MRTKFMKQLEAFVKKSNLSKHDIVDAIDFFEKHKRNHKKSGLIKFGPCINCGKEIKYKGVSQGQARQGDAWLWNKIEKWKVPAKIKANYSDSATINGISLNTVELYSCGDCFIELKKRANRYLESREKLRCYNKEKVRTHKNKYLSWCKESLNSETVHIADIFTTYINEVLDYQIDPYDQKLPDYEDINDIYYEIVKRYKAYKENYTCKLCGDKQSNIILIEKDFLYWNESLHRNLDRMICICQNCYNEAELKEKNGITFGYRFIDDY